MRPGSRSILPTATARDLRRSWRSSTARAWMDLNRGPLPYQFWPDRRLVGKRSAILGVIVGRVGSVWGGVAVTVGLSALRRLYLASCRGSYLASHDPLVPGSA